MKRNWEYKKLGDVCVSKSGIGRALKTFDSSDEILYVDIASIDNQKHGITSYTQTKMCDAPSRAQQCLKKKDVLVSLVRPNLKNVAIVDDEKNNLVASSGFCVLRADKDILPQYVFLFVCSEKFTDYLVGLTAGANYPAVREDDVRNAVLPVPPLEEQSRIVAELDLLTGIIDKQNAQLKELDNLAQAIFYDMFGDPIENPKGWEVKTFGNIGCVERGAGISKKDFIENGLPCIHYGQLHTHFGAVACEHKTCIPKNLLPKYKIAHTGDVVMAITSEDVEGSCKSTAWLGNYDVIVGSDAAIFHHNINGVYVSYFTQTQAFYNEKAKYAKGFKVTHISTAEIESIPIPLPPLALQQSFAEKIQSIEKQKETIRASIADTQKLLDYTMDKYFG